MARSSSPPLLSELRNAPSAAAVNLALRKLKNEIIGHGQKKKQWVEDGILKFLVRILGFSDGLGHLALANRQNAGDAPARREEEEAILQAIIVIGSLADGGPAFVPPIYASDTLPSLFHLLDPNVSSARVILQSLRTLNKIAEALTLAAPQHVLDGGFMRVLYNHDTLRNIAVLVTEESLFGAGMPQVELIALLFSNTCHEEYQRRLLDNAGVLESFASLLKIWIASTFVPQVEQLSVQWEPRLTISDASPSDLLRHASVLHVIGIIVKLSSTRIQRLLTTCLSIFEHMDGKFHDAWANMTASLPPNHKINLPGPPTCVDCLLPKLPSTTQKGLELANLSDPVWDGIKIVERPGGKGSSSAIELFASHGLERVTHRESTLIPWLIHMSRTSNDLISISSMSLLSTLYQLRFTKVAREVSIALLLVPSLVQKLNETFLLPGRAKAASQTGSFPLLADQIKAEAPTILAKFTINNPQTQKAAFDAGAIKNLGQLLKETYAPIDAEASQPLWTPDGGDNTRMLDDDESRQTGLDGISPAAHHVMRIRENTLVALAALASTKDEYRKAIVENGVVPFAVRSMKAEEVRFASSKAAAEPEGISIEQRIAANCCLESVLAACGLIRALSRSVATLRTSMVEAGLLPPLFALLRCNNMTLKIQSTAVVINLALEFSPLKEAVLEEGIHTLLCDYAHSNDPSLRLNALWAIKHLVTSTSFEYRTTILDTLGITWLKNLINSDPEAQAPSRYTNIDDGATTPVRMGTPNAAGETVDLLNAVDSSSRAASQDPELFRPEPNTISEALQDHDLAFESTHQLSRPSRTNTTQANTRNPQLTFSTTSDETAILQQSLEILQNIVLAPSLSRMISHILTAFNANDFFAILASKLRPSPSTSSSSSSPRRTHSQPDPAIITTVIQTLVNISASRAHKSLLLSQPRLLEALMQCLEHREPRIRAAVLWMLVNLTWDEDAGDQGDARERVRRLVEMGWGDKVRGMAEGEEDLNCRERARNVLQQMGGGGLR